MIIPLLTGRLSLSVLAKALSTDFKGEDVAPCRLVTDSREIEKGDLFCALKGKCDGHTFAKEAEERGAVAILAERKTDSLLPHLLVRSVEEALLAWASLVLKGHPCLKIAITGSVGKTTAKEKCATVLKECFRVHKTEGNRNNQLGVPFTVLSMPKNTEVLIAECGMNSRGEIARLSGTLCPDIAIITSIGYAHIGRLGSREEIAAAKMEILLGMREDAPLFLPMGEALLSPCFTRENVYSVLPFEEKNPYFPLPEDIAERWGLGFAYRLGRHLKIEEKALYKGLAEAAKTPTRRQISTVKGVTLINDTYNASPESVIAALDLLSDLKAKRRIAVLGTMLELGAASPLLHRAVARHAARASDCLFYYGKEAEAIKEGALGGGIAKERLFLFPSLEEIKPALLSFISKGDAILFKASRGMRADQLFAAVNALCKNF